MADGSCGVELLSCNADTDCQDIEICRAGTCIECDLSYGVIEERSTGRTCAANEGSACVTDENCVTGLGCNIAQGETLGVCAAVTIACGDGTRDAGEFCDDGNILGNDGCSATCTVETHYACSEETRASPSVCGPRLLGDVIIPLDGIVSLEELNAFIQNYLGGSATLEELNLVIQNYLGG
jgi:cysteine-rich repeat protein